MRIIIHIEVNAMMLETNQMIAVTQLQKELTKKVREVSESGEALYILKNNSMEAVMLSFKEYEYLHDLEELFEYIEIQTLLKERLENYNPDNNISWNQIREDI
jgi:PHD/YefM family antitoxin component YafN of YafNO toxin-antitoxin module